MVVDMITMATVEKIQLQQHSNSQCGPLTDLMAGGGEIFDALSVLADSEYLAQILEGQDGINSSWIPSTNTTSPSTTTTAPHPHLHGDGMDEDSGGGGGGGGCCSCRGTTPTSTVSTHHMAPGGLCAENTIPSGSTHSHTTCGSPYIDKHTVKTTQHSHIPHITAQNDNHHHHQFHNHQIHNRCGAGLQPLTIPLPQEPSSPSWLDPTECGLQGLESDPGFYRADMSYYPASGSESSGDNCSPGYDTTTFSSLDYVLTNMDTNNSMNPTQQQQQHRPQNNSLSNMIVAPVANVNNLKDLTNTINVKQEVVPQRSASCAFVTSTSASTLNGPMGYNSSSPQEDRPAPSSPSTAASYQENTGMVASMYDTTTNNNLDTISQTSYLSDEGSEANLSSGGDKPDRRLRRREQNRQAARRCRQRKKEQSQELVKEYYQLLSANSEMQSKLKLLETEKQRLKDIYDAHLASCSMHVMTTSE